MPVTVKGFVDYYKTQDSDLKNVALKFEQFATEYTDFFLKMCESEGVSISGGEDARYSLLDHCYAAGVFTRCMLAKGYSMQNVNAFLHQDDPKMLVMLHTDCSIDDLEWDTTLLEPAMNGYIKKNLPEDLKTAYRNCFAGAFIMGMMKE